MPDWIAVVILGIIEGITEFIPVSSTGHLLHRRALAAAPEATSSTSSSNAARSSPCCRCFRSGFTNSFSSGATGKRKVTRLKIFVAFFITGVGGLVLEKEGFKLPEQLAPIAWAWLIGGIGFVAIEWWLRGKKLSNEITWSVVIAVGVGQLIAAVFPGTSRSGSTILLCLLLGLNRPAATEFSFLVGIPTMLAAGGSGNFQAIASSGGGRAAGTLGHGAAGRRWSPPPSPSSR